MYARGSDFRSGLILAGSMIVAVLCFLGDANCQSSAKDLYKRGELELKQGKIKRAELEDSENPFVKRVSAKIKHDLSNELVGKMQFHPDDSLGRLIESADAARYALFLS